MSVSATKTDAGALALEAQGLNVTFRTDGRLVEVLRDVDLRIERGKTLILLGESGAGKSVTARSIMRLHGSNAVSDGHVAVGGRDLTGLSEAAMTDVRGSLIGFVPQDPFGSFDPLRRISSQIVEVLRRHEIEQSRKAAKERARELVATVGIPDPDRALAAYPHELSGGMRQRIAIAIAVSGNPTLLIADEATSALDASVQLRILELLEDLQSQLGMAILMITHDMGVALKVGGDVGIMYAGRIVESGPTTEVLAKPLHPYTSALLDCLPTPDIAPGSLPSIRGQAPLAGTAPSGCAFHPRCLHAIESCKQRRPELIEVAPGRFAACPVVAPIQAEELKR